MKGEVLNATWGRTHAHDSSQNFVSEGAEDVNKTISIVFNLCLFQQWLLDVVTNVDSIITFELWFFGTLWHLCHPDFHHSEQSHDNAFAILK